MKPNHIIAILFIMLLGCATSKEPDLVLQDFETVVFEDGLTLEEAIFVAKKELRDKTHKEDYLIDEPKVVTQFENVPHHDDFWFVSFQEAEKSVVPDVYMVAIQKEDGKIVFSRAYVPENEWVLEAFFLKLYEKQKNIDPRL